MSCRYYINYGSSCPPKADEEFQSKIEKVFEFHQGLPGYHLKPVVKLTSLARKTGLHSIWLKDESTRFGVQAFKALGASWAIQNFLRENPGNYTFCTATDGNHGRAVAWISRIYNQKAVVFMPAMTVKSRIRNIEKEGAMVYMIDGDYDLCVQRAIEASQRNGYILFQDTSWKGYEYIPALITEGYSTLIHEIILETGSDRNTPPFDLIFLQAGVGGWASSVIHYLCNFYGKRKPKILVVEPDSADCILESIGNGKITKTKGLQDTIMAGLNCGTPSLIAFDLIKSAADVFISIPDDYAKLSLRIFQNPLAGDPVTESCESGAAGLAGLLAVIYSKELKEVRKYLNLNKHSRVMLINTEGNTDPDMNSKIMMENLIHPWDKL